MPDDPPALPPQPAAPRSWLRWFAQRITCLAAWASVGASVYAFFHAAHWTVRVVTPFRPQLMVIGLLAFLIGRRLGAGWWTRGGGLLALALNLVVLWPWLVPVSGPAPAETFRLMHWNTWRDHADPEAAFAEAAASGADVVLLCELPRWQVGAPIELQGYETHTVTEYAIAVRTGGPVELLSVRHARPPNCLEALVRFRGEELRLLVTHVPRPTGKYGCWMQDRKAGLIRKWFRSSDLPTVLTGDFNLTPWCRLQSQLIDELELADTSRGRGLSYTFPGGWPVLGRLVGVPIDQVLLTGQLGCSRRWVGRAAGSNHRPVFADIGLVD